MGCVVKATPWLLFTPGKDPVPTVQEAGWATGPVWTGAENLAPAGIRSPDLPARSESLHRLRYPGPLHTLPVAYPAHPIPSHLILRDFIVLVKDAEE